MLKSGIIGPSQNPLCLFNTPSEEKRWKLEVWCGLQVFKFYNHQKQVSVPLIEDLMDELGGAKYSQNLM